MRGKSVDIEYISVFVEECVKNEKVTPKDIASEAKIRINNIDHEIRRIENLKSERSKLVDVVNSFDAPEEESDDNEDAVFANDECLEDVLTQQICQYIGAEGSVSIKQILAQFGEPLKEQIFFAVKKLAEAGFIARNTERNFVKGPKWNNLPKDMLT